MITRERKKQSTVTARNRGVTRASDTEPQEKKVPKRGYYRPCRTIGPALFGLGPLVYRNCTPDCIKQNNTPAAKSRSLSKLTFARCVWAVCGASIIRATGGVYLQEGYSLVAPLSAYRLVPGSITRRFSFWNNLHELLMRTIYLCSGTLLESWKESCVKQTRRLQHQFTEQRGRLSPAKHRGRPSASRSNADDSTSRTNAGGSVSLRGLVSKVSGAKLRDVRAGHANCRMLHTRAL